MSKYDWKIGQIKEIGTLAKVRRFLPDQHCVCMAFSDTDLLIYSKGTDFLN